MTRETVQPWTITTTLRSLDYVSPKVAALLLIEAGGRVYNGADDLPDEVVDLLRGHESYRGQTSEHAAIVTIAHTGTSFTANVIGPRGYTSSGYAGHNYLKYIGPDTLVFDWRPVADDAAFRLAISGPMVKPELDGWTYQPFAV